MVRVPHHTSLDAKRFVFSVLVEGCSYKVASHLFLWNGISPPASSTFYKAQVEVGDAILQMARDSCAKKRAKLKNGSTISFDGAWSHRRNANQCLVDIINPETRDVLDFEILEKSHGRFIGNYQGPSNMMEVEGIKRMIPRWKEDSRIYAYVHDKDSKSKKAIDASGWDIRELIDKNHLMKSWERKFKKYKKKADAKLKGLHDKLRRYFVYLINSDELAEDKLQLWLNATAHYSGNHEACKHSEECQSYTWADADIGNNSFILDQFLLSSSKLLIKCDKSLSTQMCESLHAIKAHLASKMLNWGISWKYRIGASILTVNEENWKFKLYRNLNLPEMDKSISLQLHESEIMIDKLKAARRTPEYLIKARNYRINRRKMMKNQISKSPCGYKPLENTSNKVKRTYKIRKMPKKLNKINPYFQKFGFTGTNQDDEDDDLYILSESSESDFSQVLTSDSDIGESISDDSEFFPEDCTSLVSDEEFMVFI